MNIHDQPEGLDYLAPTPDSLEINSFNVKGAVFVIPIDAPIPSELSEVAIPAGSLYKRLAALDSAESDDFKFVPLGGAELLSIERAWPALQTAKKVFALFDLPGSRYDVMFTQAVRQIGLRRVEWPAVSEALANKVRENQRTSDTTPWQLAKPTAPVTTKRLPRANSVIDVGNPESDPDGLTQ